MPAARPGKQRVRGQEILNSVTSGTCKTGFYLEMKHYYGAAAAAGQSQGAACSKHGPSVHSAFFPSAGILQSERPLCLTALCVSTYSLNLIPDYTCSLPEIKSLMVSSLNGWTLTYGFTLIRQETQALYFSRETHKFGGATKLMFPCFFCQRVGCCR